MRCMLECRDRPRQRQSGRHLFQGVQLVHLHSCGSRRSADALQSLGLRSLRRWELDLAWQRPVHHGELHCDTIDRLMRWEFEYRISYGIGVMGISPNRQLRLGQGTPKGI